LVKNDKHMFSHTALGLLGDTKHADTRRYLLRRC